jgi:hypothetical protein
MLRRAFRSTRQKVIGSRTVSPRATMQHQSRAEFEESQVRRLLTVLFLTRAKRHLKTLAEVYSWSPEQLLEYEERFIQYNACVPIFATDTERVRAHLDIDE